MNEVKHCLKAIAAATLLLASVTASAANDQPFATIENSSFLLAEMNQNMDHGMHNQPGGQMQGRDMKNMDHSQHQNMGGKPMQHENMKGMQDAADKTESTDSTTEKQMPANAMDSDDE